MPAGASCLVVMGASTGGVAALLKVAAALPPDFPAVICAVLHTGNQPSLLPQLLEARGPLRSMYARHGDVLEPGVIYVPPPDHHLMVNDGRAMLSKGPKENHVRPAIDPLFRSAAVHWRESAIGVVMTGKLDDGAAGLRAIADCGGWPVVQHPDDALEPEMPAAAIRAVPHACSVPLGDIAPLLTTLADHLRTDGAGRPEPPAALMHELRMSEGEDAMPHLEAIGQPSALTCPECGGGLWAVGARPQRYRCHTGHAYSALTLRRAQSGVAEEALWRGMRSVREREMLMRRMVANARKEGWLAEADHHTDTADILRGRAARLKALLDEGEPEPEPESGTPRLASPSDGPDG